MDVDDEELDNDEDEDDLNSNLSANLVLGTEPKTTGTSSLDTIAAIENEVARAHDLLDLELSGHGFKRSAALSATTQQRANSRGFYSQMPAGIRSAIVASAAIVLTSLTTFLVMFVVCRWKQHRRRRTQLMKSYNAMKSKLPTMSAKTCRRSTSMRNMEELIGAVATVSSATPVHHQQKQSSLIYSNRNETPTSASSKLHSQPKPHQTSVTCTATATSSRGGAFGAGLNTSKSGNISANSSTTSLALSLRSSGGGHNNLSSSKLNSLNSNSPEVQEYLFDALRSHQSF